MLSNTINSKKGQPEVCTFSENTRLLLKMSGFLLVYCNRALCATAYPATCAVLVLSLCQHLIPLIDSVLETC